MLDFTKGSVTTPESEQKGDERDDGRKSRGRFRRKAALRTVGMIVAAAVCAGLWSTVTEATNASAAPVPGAFKAVTADIDGDGRDDVVWNQVVQGLNRTYVGLGKADGTLQYLPPAGQSVWC